MPSITSASGVFVRTVDDAPFGRCAACRENVVGFAEIARADLVAHRARHAVAAPADRWRLRERSSAAAGPSTRVCAGASARGSAGTRPGPRERGPDAQFALALATCRPPVGIAEAVGHHGRLPGARAATRPRRIGERIAWLNVRARHCGSARSRPLVAKIGVAAFGLADLRPTAARDRSARAAVGLAFGDPVVADPEDGCPFPPARPERTPS